MSRHLLSATACLAALTFGSTRAQAPLTLDIVGGSEPGAIDFDVGGGTPFDVAFLLMGIDAGPTPLSLLDPSDTRHLDVGLQQLSIFWGFFGFDQHFRLGPWSVPAAPAFIDVPLFFQALTLGGVQFVGQLSPPVAIRFGPAGSFHDRGVFANSDRAFSTIVPRADGRWLMVGGGRGALLAQIADPTTEIYDDVTDTFLPGPLTNFGRSLHTATHLPDGRWLFVGGVDIANDPQATCEIYDPVADVFLPVAPMGTPRAAHTATLLPDGRVLVTGGLQAMTVQPTPLQAIFDTVATTELYSPATNTWAPGPNMRTPRVGHLAILRPDGRVLLAGGISWDDLIIVKLPAVRSNTDVFNPVTNTMANGPSMATAHSLTDPVALGNNRWLVAGGIANVTLTNLGTPTAVSEVYDAALNTWSSAGSMSVARGNQRSLVLGGGRVLVFGGANGNILTPTPLATGEVYDANSNSWSPGPAMTIPRAGAAIYLTPRGQVHVIGGGTANGTIARGTEWYFF